MGEIKHRDYVFDTFRGLCVWCIPISHFTRMAGHFSHDSVSGVIYITINIFVMQAFMFLSGYFSKKPEKSRQIAFKIFLWPYILSIFFFYGVRTLLWGHANLYFDQPPFAMWFMFALFLYKLFQKNYIKVPHFFAITFVLYLVAGCIPFLTEYLSLGRLVSYFSFFSWDTTAMRNTSPRSNASRSGRVWSWASCWWVFQSILPTDLLAFRWNGTCSDGQAREIGVVWYVDILMRFVLFVLGCAWLVLMFNILPGKDNYLAYVGRNTMPVYIFHLVVRQWIKKHGITMGFFCPAAGGQSAVSAADPGLSVPMCRGILVKTGVEVL